MDTERTGKVAQVYVKKNEDAESKKIASTRRAETISKYDSIKMRQQLRLYTCPRYISSLPANEAQLPAS
ncbi:hypothetical protein, partial [Paenibacillus sp. 2TAB23]|uniref:hypothetical protein n=1 Tax=Paenibacillus sp. 2TAB23 TaxID=3233004 RepID=UPI003F96F9AD